MSATETPMWEYEAADPEVGFLTDTITHACEANEDAEPAEYADVTRATVTHNGEQQVAETTTLRCPVCKATTAYTEHWPLWFFTEPRDPFEEGE